MSWADQSSQHQKIHRFSVIFFHLMFALPAMLGGFLLWQACYRLFKTDRWQTPSLYRFLRDMDTRLVDSGSVMSNALDSIPLWLACFTLSLLIFAWSTQTDS